MNTPSTSDAHTPTPWQVVNTFHIGPKVCSTERTHIAKGVEAANAALIVRAVNTHAELIIALGQAAAMLAMEARSHRDSLDPVRQRMAGSVQAAADRAYAVLRVATNEHATEDSSR